MFYCRQYVLDSNSNVIGAQFIDLNIINQGNPAPTLLQDAQTICHANNALFDAIDGYMTFSGDSALNALFAQYFAFDAQIFEIIIGGTLVAYALGHGTGAVIKMMGRT